MSLRYRSKTEFHCVQQLYYEYETIILLTATVEQYESAEHNGNDTIMGFPAGCGKSFVLILLLQSAALYH